MELGEQEYLISKKILIDFAGPCNIVSSNKTEFNPYSWNNNANIFFIDQPVGVGNSYADYGEFVVRGN